MAGLPGSGKSTLALALGRRLGWPVLDKDSIKSPLLDLGAGEDLAGPASYVLLYEMARDMVAGQQLSLILDSPAAYPEVVARAEAISLEAGGCLRVLLCHARRESRRKRQMERTSKLSQPGPAIRPGDSLAELSATAEDRALERFSHLPPTRLELDTEQPLEIVLEEAVAYVKDGRG
jgi:predicted kinase